MKKKTQTCELSDTGIAFALPKHSGTQFFSYEDVYENMLYVDYGYFCNHTF